VVVDEGKGPDFVLEVLHDGDRKKDLVGNVERYARLGIHESFVYDRRRQKLHGWHLPRGGAFTYQCTEQRGVGHLPSQVLGVDLAILENNLRFLVGEATLPVSAE
jgi:Uma2 family endonuclease